MIFLLVIIVCVYFIHSISATTAATISVIKSRINNDNEQSGPPSNVLLVDSVRHRKASRTSKTIGSFVPLSSKQYRKVTYRIQQQQNLQEKVQQQQRPFPLRTTNWIQRNPTKISFMPKSQQSSVESLLSTSTDIQSDAIAGDDKNKEYHHDEYPKYKNRATILENLITNVLVPEANLTQSKLLILQSIVTNQKQQIDKITLENTELRTTSNMFNEIIEEHEQIIFQEKEKFAQLQYRIEQEQQYQVQQQQIVDEKESVIVQQEEKLLKQQQFIAFLLLVSNYQQLQQKEQTLQLEATISNYNTVLGRSDRNEMADDIGPAVLETSNALYTNAITERIEEQNEIIREYNETVHGLQIQNLKLQEDYNILQNELITLQHEQSVNATTTTGTDREEEKISTVTSIESEMNEPERIDNNNLNDKATLEINDYLQETGELQLKTESMKQQTLDEHQQLNNTINTAQPRTAKPDVDDTNVNESKIERNCDTGTQDAADFDADANNVDVDEVLAIAQAAVTAAEKSELWMQQQYDELKQSYQKLEHNFMLLQSKGNTALQSTITEKDIAKIDASLSEVATLRVISQPGSELQEMYKTSSDNDETKNDINAQVKVEDFVIKPNVQVNVANTNEQRTMSNENSNVEENEIVLDEAYYRSKSRRQRLWQWIRRTVDKVPSIITRLKHLKRPNDNIEQR